MKYLVYLTKYNIVHVLVLLISIFVGLYLIPKVFNDILFRFILTTIYFIVINLYVIFWVIRFGVKEKSQLTKTLKLPSKTIDYFLMAIIFFGTFLISELFVIAKETHIFDFLSTNLQIPVLFPSLNIANEMPIFITLLVLFSTITLVISEELFFHAYLFEKQFTYLNNLTWIVNGLFFTIYHMFSKFNLFELLPIALLSSFVYQKSRSIIITYIPHIIINLLSNIQFIIPLFRQQQ